MARKKFVIKTTKHLKDLIWRIVDVNGGESAEIGIVIDVDTDGWLFKVATRKGKVFWCSVDELCRVSARITPDWQD